MPDILAQKLISFFHRYIELFFSRRLIQSKNGHDHQALLQLNMERLPLRFHSVQHVSEVLPLCYHNVR